MKLYIGLSVLRECFYTTSSRVWAAVHAPDDGGSSMLCRLQGDKMPVLKTVSFRSDPEYNIAAIYPTPTSALPMMDRAEETLHKYPSKG